MTSVDLQMTSGSNIGQISVILRKVYIEFVHLRPYTRSNFRVEVI